MKHTHMTAWWFGLWRGREALAKEGQRSIHTWAPDGSAPPFTGSLGEVGAWSPVRAVPHSRWEGLRAYVKR